VQSFFSDIHQVAMASQQDDGVIVVNAVDTFMQVIKQY